MPYMYLAKINLNSKIFDVYKKELSIDKVCNDVYNSFKDQYTFIKNKTIRYTDSYGQEKEFTETDKYLFTEIEKKDNQDGKIITGKVLRTVPKLTEEEVDGKIIKKTIEESASIYFYYDVNQELVAFCERQLFGYNQFMLAFKEMLNENVEGYEFEVFLKKDFGKLNDKIRRLKRVTKVRAELIPPNSNEEELSKLRDSLSYLNQCKESNAKKMILEVSSDEINMYAKSMTDIVSAASMGYGEVSATGINMENKQQIIKSNRDAPAIINTPDNISKHSFNELAKNFISSIRKNFEGFL